MSKQGPLGRLVSYVKHLFTGTLGAGKSKIRLLCVGMANSRKYGSCPGAGLDAQRIHDKVKAGKKVLLQSSQATILSVLSALREGISKTSSDGLFIFFYSGHGGQRKSSDPSETDGRDETLCLWDGELVDNQIWDVLQTAKCRVFMVTDCCNSGTNYRAVGPFFASRSEEATALKSVSLLHWGGCSDGRYSYGDDSGGTMTNAILGQMNSGVSYKKAFKAVVKACSAQQDPNCTCMGFDQDVELFK